MYEFRVIFNLKGKFKYSFSDVVEYEDIKLRTEDGKIHGETSLLLERADINLAREMAIEKIEKLTSLLTLIFKEGLIIENINVIPVPTVTVIDRGREKVIEIHDYKQIKIEVEAHLEVYRKFSKEETDRIKAELRKLSSRVSELEHGKDLLRAIKWWRKGYFEEDKVDKFLDYYIVFEMLASIMDYKKCEKSEEKCKTKCNWAERFAKDYSITYEIIENANLAYIRNKILHAPGPEKDEAEKLAMRHADRFGIELLNAIKKIIDQGFQM